MAKHAQDFLRTQMMPHIWCPGCGHGIIMGSILRAISNAGLDQDKTVIVSGIGCSSRASGYMDFDTIHTTHGRALAFATGVKMARPELNVVVIMGDGDCSAIGGNHFIHACRRNIDLTAIVFNNSIYGMTSGQYSPLTPVGRLASTAPYGTIEHEFDLCDLARSAGASFVGRATAYHATLLTGLIEKGFKNKGFSFIEAISQCPTYYGRKNKMGGPLELMNWQKENAVPIQAVDRMTAEQLAGKFTIGELHNQPAAEYTEEYAKLTARAKGE